MKAHSLLAAVFLLATTAFRVGATVTLPALFCDHMVLQRDAALPFWGTAGPEESVTVTAGTSTATTKAGPDGKWMVKLDKLPASGKPMEVTIAGTNTITLHDVLVGDVWVCSGQSNMAFALASSSSAKTELPQALHSDLRLFFVKTHAAFKPESDCTGQWTICTPDSAKGFSGVGYFFGKEIMEAEKVPVGMIGAYQGATPAQAWTSLDTLNRDPELKKAYGDAFTNLISNIDAVKAVHDEWLANGGTDYKAALKQYHVEAFQAKAKGLPAPPRPTPPATPEPPSPEDLTHPSVLFNGMIAPLMPFAIKGVIWYQGESNAGPHILYRKLFPAMITDWRSHWGAGNFPFIYVQLPNYGKREDQPVSGEYGWASLRETQLSALASVPATGMAITIDAGDGNDLHPPYKDIVGHRLALAARHVAYGEELDYSGPLYDSSQVSGNTVIITFKNTGTGLKIGTPPVVPPGATPPPTDILKGFTVAGSDRKFVWADASIAGPNTVTVSSKQVPSPVYVRYGWGANPEVNLANSAGLPASPFRTDPPAAP